MPASDTLSRPTLTLRAKLERVVLVRALMATLLLGSAVVVNLNDLDTFSAPAYLTILALIVAVYIATVVFSVWLRHADDFRSLAYAQLVGDVVISATLVLLTGGSDSPFVFLFFLAIVTAAHVDGRSGALFEASACSVAYALILLGQGGHIPALGRLSLLLGESAEVATYTAALNILAFYTVAILAGHLAEKLGQAGSELERRRLDIRELRALNQYIVDSVGDGICSLDFDGRILSFNRAAEIITGLKADAVVGGRLEALLPVMAEVFDRYQGEPEGRSPTIELPFVCADGQRRFLSTQVAPLRDAADEPAGFILYFRDITEVRRLRHIIQRHQRLAAIGELSASIAHEIRNPLASISGSIQVLRESPGLGDTPNRRLMDIVVREVDRLNTLVEDFLAYARPRSLRLDEVDLAGLIRETVALVKNDLDQARDVQFEVTTDPAGLWVEGDADALRQVLWNLLRNAAEAIEGSGSISVSAATLYAGKPPIQHVEVTVGDNGPGLTRAQTDHLFEPFFTTKPNGTGLGLATVLRIVEAHGGLAWADEPDAEAGATFRFLIPTHHQEETSIQITAERLAVASGDESADAITDGADG